MQNSRVNTCAGVFFGKVKGSLKLYCITKRLHYRCFPLNLVKFLSAHILKNRGNERNWRNTSEAYLAFLINIKVPGWKNRGNERNWRNTSEGYLAFLINIKVPGCSLKTFLEHHYLKAIKLSQWKKSPIKSENERN